MFHVKHSTSCKPMLICSGNGTPKINLISKSTVSEIETRHIWDGAQVFSARTGTWVDLGSGGGLPGVVIAIFAQSNGLNTSVTLIESDQRKAAFLRTCARELNVPINVVAYRIEDVPALNAQTGFRAGAGTARNTAIFSIPTFSR